MLSYKLKGALKFKSSHDDDDDNHKQQLIRFVVVVESGGQPQNGLYTIQLSD